MKDTPVLLCRPMARAYRLGLKLETRRAIRRRGVMGWPTASDYYAGDSWWIEPDPSGRGWWACNTPIDDGMREVARRENCGGFPCPYCGGFPCPYGVPGDRLTFLTTWAVHPTWDRVKPLDLPKNVKVHTAFDTDFFSPSICGKLRPGRFMPLWMRDRMPKAEVTNVRAQRVQEISEEDAKLEGAREHPTDHLALTYKESFHLLWDSINAAKHHGWNTNLWVFAITFKPLPKE